MAAFRPYPDRPEVSMRYYEVPADVLEDRDDLVQWARRAVRCAMVAAPAAKTRTRR
jgi:TfoX/Sxy family transcriptional regulator of competence genes